MDKKPIFTVKSQFIPLIVGLQVLGIGVSSALFVAGAVDIFFLVISAIFGVGLSFGSMFSLIFLICAILFPAALYEIRRKNNSKTYFRFYDDYVEFCYFTGPLMNRRQGRLYYSDIADVMQYSSFMQNFVALETIRLHAPETRFYDSQKNFIGIEIPDVKISRRAGEKIQKILDRWHSLNSKRVAVGANTTEQVSAENKAVSDDNKKDVDVDGSFESEIPESLKRRADKKAAETTEATKTTDTDVSVRQRDDGEDTATSGDGRGKTDGRTVEANG